MRRTRALPGVCMIKFTSILSRYESSEFSQIEAELLGLSERTIRHRCGRFEEEGEAGLVDRRVGKASGKRVPSDREAEVEELYRTRYAGFTAKHLHEHLVGDHKFAWGYTWTKTLFDIPRACSSAPDGAARSAQAASAALAGHDAAPGRLAARVAGG